MVELSKVPLSSLYKLSVKRSGGDRFGMSVSQGLGADLQGAFGESYRLAQVALLLIEDGQIMQRLSYLRMVLTEGLFPDVQRRPLQRLGLPLLSFPPEKRCLGRER